MDSLAGSCFLVRQKLNHLYFLLFLSIHTEMSLTALSLLVRG